MRYETFEEISVGDIVSYNRVWGYVLSRFDETKTLTIIDEYTDQRHDVDYRRVQVVEKFEEVLIQFK